jgi:Carbohydrate binding domain
MHRILISAILLLSSLGVAGAEKRAYPDRWVYLPNPLRDEKDLQRAIELVTTAAGHGLNGVLFPGMDRLSLQSPAYFNRLQSFKQACDKLGVEIIPTGFNTGYGGAILSHDKNLAAGMPVLGALFVAAASDARFSPDSPMRFENGGFENGLSAFDLHHGGRVAMSLDTTVFHNGGASLRIADQGSTEPESATAIQQIRVTPNRQYRVSCWIKTEGVGTASLFTVRAEAPDHRDLSPFELPLTATADWRRITAGFNSWYADHLSLAVGASEWQKGKLWVDDCNVEEVGLLNVLRRDGTPLRVRDEATGIYYVENRDFSPVSDAALNFQWDHDGPPIRLLAGSRIRPGSRLRVDYYHGTTIYKEQVSACPSEPRVYEIWRQQIPLIEKYLHPKKYFLSLDEIRAGGHCEICKHRNMSMAQILGDMTRRIYDMIREANPAAEVFVWSDMFDPNHNGRPKYYLLNGDVSGAWEYLPKDVKVACWYYEKRSASLDFFSKRGFATLAAAYYDADDLKNPEGWMEALDDTPGAIGIMYTTWSDKYDLLAPFGDLVSKRPK